MSELFTPTNHVREKMKTRDVTWGEIVDVLENPECVYGPDYKGRKTVQKGDLCVIVGKDNVIVTVLFRDEANWTDHDMQQRARVRIEFQ